MDGWQLYQTSSAFHRVYKNDVYTKSTAPEVIQGSVIMCVCNYKTVSTYTPSDTMSETAMKQILIDCL